MHFLSFLILTTWTVLHAPIPVCSSQSFLRSLDTSPVLHFPLARRGGEFVATEWNTDHVNLTLLAQELEKTESRFDLTRRVVKGNKLVRKAKVDGLKGPDGGELLKQVAGNGLWFVISGLQCFESQKNLLVSHLL